MTLAMFRVMLLGLLRDRGALAMSFLVPAIFFLIFASIFQASSGDDLDLRVVIIGGDEVGATPDLRAHLQAHDSFEPVVPDPEDEAQARRLVQRGEADVGLVIRSSPSAAGNPPYLILADPARDMAVRLLTGELQRIHLAGPDSAAAGSKPPGSGDELWARENVTGGSAALNKVAYYAGAVAVLFLLFSAVHGAISLLEESETGLLDRILAGPGSIGVMINGKFLYLTLQGFVQVGVIFVVAWQVHGVDLPGHWPAWTVTTLAASLAAAGLALALVTCCTTRRQAQTLANVIILVLSALGGSMVPRFLMPTQLQELGWLTPNTWALEAYVSVFWRDQPVEDLYLPWALLTASGMIGLLTARLLATRLARL